MSRIRVAVVDSHTLTRYGMRQLVALQPDIEIVAECGSAADASSMLLLASPDVVTIDGLLPDGDGLRVAAELRAGSTDLGIVMLTSRGDDDLLLRAMEIGVSAFVAKTAPESEVLGAIRHAAFAPLSFTASGLAVAISRRRAARERLALSPREREVLRLLRDGMSVPSIAASMYISQSTAKTYIARLYDKLGAANRTQALMAALQLGLIHYEECQPLARHGTLLLDLERPLMHSATALTAQAMS